VAVPALLRDLRLPVIAAPMFTVSGVDLVVAACRAGVVGAFPSLNARPQEAFEEWLCRIEDAIADRRAPYAVNLICHRSNDRLAGDLETTVRHRVPIVLTSLQAPGEVVQAVHEYGGLVFHDVISRRHAEKAAEQGVDGLILVCAGAGGHAGPLNPFALIAEVRRVFSGTIILAGAITSGSGILAAQAMGADLAYLGTRFIATRESNAVDGYKQMIVASGAKDIVYTKAISGVHGNYLRGSLVAAGLDPDDLPPPEPGKNYEAGHKRERPRAWKDIWGAGQGVAGIDDVPSVAECVARLEREYAEAWARMTELGLNVGRISGASSANATHANRSR
jgi:nitronate monooxygenase